METNDLDMKSSGQGPATPEPTSELRHDSLPSTASHTERTSMNEASGATVLVGSAADSQLRGGRAGIRARSPKQQAASRMNGAKSSGPKSEDGRKTSSMNAVKHGLFSRTLLLQRVKDSSMQELLQVLRSELDPTTIEEELAIEQLVHAIAAQQLMVAHQLKLAETFEYQVLGGPGVGCLLRHISLCDRRVNEALRRYSDLVRERQSAPINLEADEIGCEGAIDSTSEN